MKKFWKTIALLSLCVFGLCACAAEKKEPFKMEDITLEELGVKIENGESFTLLVERDNCPFCEALNTYVEETEKEHAGSVVYRIATTDFKLAREEEGDMTLISETPEGTQFLEYFPYFLYTPSLYHIENGEATEVAVGYDEGSHAVSKWNVNSTIDFNQSEPVDVWTWIESVQPSPITDEEKAD